MTNRRLFLITGSLLTASTLASAQDPPAPPAPPAAPVPVAAPAVPQVAPEPPEPFPAPKPVPAAAPLPPKPPGWEFQFDHDFQYKFDLDNLNINIEEIQRNARDAAEEAMEKVRRFGPDVEELKRRAQDAAQEAMEKVRRIGPDFDLAFGKPPAPPFAFAPQAGPKRLSGQSEDSLYQRGQRALDGNQWEDAVAYFNQAALANGNRADGSLYWKAYALNKLGRGAEAKTVLADLRAKHTNSRWLDDAKALDLQIAQASGAPVSPEDYETNEGVKILAISGIMQSDPERGMPLLENILKGAASPRVKQRALYVLAQSSSPRAQATLEQIAKGASNPDLQVKAIQYMNERRRPNASQLFSEIYAGTNDRDVKRAIIQAYASRNEKDRLLAVLKTEKDLDLKRMAYGRLGESPGNPELWQIYESETSPEGKKALLDHMHRNTNVDKLLAVIRNEKDPEVRRTAIHVLADQRTTPSTDALVQVYNSEADAQIKRSIADSLSRNVPALISLARAEKDPKMKLFLVERISNMASRDKAAADYLEELLK